MRPHGTGSEFCGAGLNVEFPRTSVPQWRRRAGRMDAVLGCRHDAASADKAADSAIGILRAVVQPGVVGFPGLASAARPPPRPG